MCSRLQNTAAAVGRNTTTTQDVYDGSGNRCPFPPVASSAGPRSPRWSFASCWAGHPHRLPPLLPASAAGHLSPPAIKQEAATQEGRKKTPRIRAFGCSLFKALVDTRFAGVLKTNLQAVSFDFRQGKTAIIAHCCCPISRGKQTTGFSLTPLFPPSPSQECPA